MEKSNLLDELNNSLNDHMNESYWLLDENLDPIDDSDINIENIDVSSIYTMSMEALVNKTFKGYKIEIYPREHPPPHFTVSSPDGLSGNYAIKDCKLLTPDNKFTQRNKVYIKKYWSDNKQKLINFWNEIRPDDCPVGKITSFD